MTQMPIAEAMMGGYEPPRNCQFGVFLDNKVGKLLDLLGAFDNSTLTLAALSVAEASDHAVVRLVTSNSELARRLLKRRGFAFSETDVLVVELSSGQSLKGLCRALLTAELSIDYAYPMLVRPRGRPAIVLHGDDLVLAGQILRRKLFTLLGENDLGENASGSDPSDPDPGGLGAPDI
jgi:hypothetical protein